MQSQEKIGIVLFNLGGPDSLDAIKPFLHNLFLDPDILKFPLSFLFRRPLAWLISTLRAKKTRGYYEYMGGKSPLKELTLQQAGALEKALNLDFPARVVVAMRYWKPSTEEAIQTLQEEKIRKVILLPLYPHYSYTTTRSSAEEWKRCRKKMGVSFEEIWIQDYHDHPGYIASVVDRIEEGLRRFPEEKRAQVHLVYSAHGIPLKEIEAGDPYQTQIQRTVELINLSLGNRYSHTLCYQSRVGPLKWLEPNTVDSITALAKKGVKQMLAIPISFVSDHSETLYELKKVYGELALGLGVEQYELMPALNDSPLFIGALKELAISCMASI